MYIYIIIMLGTAIVSYTSSLSPADIVAPIVSAVVSVCLVIAVCATILVIVCVYNRTKVKKYYRKWTLSTSQR